MTGQSENKIISSFQNKIGRKNFLKDDVESFKLGKEHVILKVDTLVESTDIPARTRLDYAAKKSITSAVSDFAAKGVQPKCGLVSITLPKKITKKQVDLIAKGLKEGSKQYGFRIIGGDTNEGKEISFSIVLCGRSSGFPKRNSAKVNDIIFTTGIFGYSAAGIQILLKNSKANSQFKKKAVSLAINPKAQLKFGVAAMRFCNSSMDSSDGLSTTLNQMANQSKKQFVITHIPTDNKVIEFAKTNHLKPRKIIFDGGEEYEIVFTTPKTNIPKVKKIARALKTPIIEIGYVTSGRGVFLKQDRTRILDDGWQHFKTDLK